MVTAAIVIIKAAEDWLSTCWIFNLFIFLVNSVKRNHLGGIVPKTLNVYTLLQNHNNALNEHDDTKLGDATEHSTALYGHGSSIGHVLYEVKVINIVKISINYLRIFTTQIERFSSLRSCGGFLITNAL